MKKLLSIILILSLLLAMLASCDTPSEDADGDKDSDGETVPNASEYAESRDVTGRNIAYVTVKVKSYGSFKLLLDATTAPRTVANFLTLVKNGFYNGVSFHAVQEINGAEIVMGGDPNGNGSGGSDESIKGECAYNGYANDISHKHGTISMLHSNYSLDDATSHFFIMNGDLADLDGSYASFGYVVDGLGVIDEISKAGIEHTESTGLIAKNRQPIIESITVDKDIDYTLIRDVYVAPPSAEELERALISGGNYKLTSVSYAPATVKRMYKTDNGYVFQITATSDDKFTNLLVGVTSEGNLSNSLSLDGSDTLEDFFEFHDAINSLNLESLMASTDIPELLKSYCKDALSTVKAIGADGSKSKYVYTRDTEGRETYTVEMKLKDYEEPIIILLDATTAPITVENFISLVEKGFYNGLDFHRIIKGFMIQGGDDTHLPKEEQAASIKGEFDSNGHPNDIKHIRGTISMARTSVKDSASSGFFICDADAPHLDGDYAAFGYVLSGMATVDAVADYAVGKTDSNGNLNSGVEQPTIEYIKIISAE